MSDGEAQKLVDAVADATRTGMGRMSASQLDQGWQQLERALDQGKFPSVPIVPVRSRWWLRGLALGTAAALLALGTHRVLRERADAPLQYVVEGAVLGPGESIRAEASSTARLVFSDDSRIRMAPATKVRVLGRDAHGSRISLRDGELEVDIRHRAEASWRFEAGPFTVKVVGTSFHLGFDERRGRLRLRMSSGVVEARGPSPDRVFTLRAGESLELFADTASKSVTAAVPPSAPAAAPLSPPQAVREPAPSSVAPPSQASPTGSRRRLAHVDRAEVGPAPGHWARLIGRGDFARVVREAEHHGLDAVFASAPAAELTALADAARYLRRNGLARQALLGLRARFPDTARASEAAFFLGRLAEQPPSSTSAAVAWYETYLAEAARGPYAGEALGREMALLARTDRARAREAARAYLERFPTGPQSELARVLLSEP